MLWRHRYIVAAIVVACTALALLTRPPEPESLYTSTMSLKVQTLSFSASGGEVVTAVEGVPPAEVERARNVQVAAETAGELGLEDNGAGIIASLSATAGEGTDLLQLALTGEGTDTETELVTYAENYVDFRQEQDEEQLDAAIAEVDKSIGLLEPVLERLSNRIEKGDSSPQTRANFNANSAILTSLIAKQSELALDARLAGDQVEVVGSPITQRLGTLPTRTLRVVAGPLVGLLLGCAIVIALGLLRPRVGGRERTEERLGFPVLTSVPKVRAGRLRRDPLALQKVSGWAAESFRMLRTELQLIEERTGPLGTIAVASPEPRDGKSTVAANLAASYHSAGRRTILVHADLRASKKHRAPKGLTDFVAGRTDKLPITRSRGGYDEILTGPMQVSGGPRSPQEMLVEAVESLRGDYDVVVVDTAPLLAFSDALLLALEASAIVLVLRSGRTLENRAEEAIEVLMRHDAPIAGLVLNGKTRSRMEKLRYRRYYRAWNEEVGQARKVRPVPDRIRPRPRNGPGPTGKQPDASSSLKEARR